MTAPCLGPKDPDRLFSDRCLQPAAFHDATTGRPLCPVCADRLAKALRSPNSLGNVIAGRARTEAEIARIIRPLH